MPRRLLASALVLVACAEHTPEYQDLLDKFGSEATGGGTASDTTNNPTSGPSTTTTGDSAGNTEAGVDSGAETGPATSDESGSSTANTEESGSLPIDPPPTVENLACDPVKAEEVGPVTCNYDFSADVTHAELLD